MSRDGAPIFTRFEGSKLAGCGIAGGEAAIGAETFGVQAAAGGLPNGVLLTRGGAKTNGVENLRLGTGGCLRRVLRAGAEAKVAAASRAYVIHTHNTKQMAYN